MKKILIRTSALAKRFGRVQALRHVDLDLVSGSVTVFLGENGAGKTTTLKIILGFLFPDEGRVEKSDDRLRLGYIPEQLAAFPWLKGKEILACTAGLYGLSAIKVERRAERLASLLGFDLALLERRVRTYSHGNQKKFAYLQSLLVEPEVLIVDEPFMALDPVAIKKVRDLFLELRSEGRTILLSSHLISEAEKIADRVVIIRRGETVLQANWEDLRQNQVVVRAKAESREGVRLVELAPAARCRDGAIELICPRTEWQKIKFSLGEGEGIEVKEPDLESFFLFYTRP